MGKRTDATVYYCDICKKTIVGEPNVVRNAEFFGTAYNAKIQDKEQETFFTPNPINKVIVPEIKISVMDVSPDGTHYDGAIEVKSQVKYLCSEHMEEIVAPYIEYCNKIEQLFTKSNVSKTSM